MQHNLNLNDSTSDSGNIQKIITEMHDIILKPQKDFDTCTRLGSYRNYKRHINGFETVSIGDFVHPRGYDDGIIDLNKIKLIGTKPQKQVKYMEIPEKPKYLTMVQRNQLEVTNDTLVIREIFIRSSTYTQNVFRNDYTIVLRDLQLTNEMMYPGFIRVHNKEKFIFPPRPSISPPRKQVNFIKNTVKGCRISELDAQVGWLPGISSILSQDVPLKIEGIVNSLNAAMPRLHQNNDEMLKMLKKVNNMLSKENEESVKKYVRENIERLQKNNDIHSVSDNALKGLSLIMFVSAAAYAYSTRSNEAYAALSAATVGVVYFYKDNLTMLLPMFSKLAIKHTHSVDMQDVNTMEAQVNLGEGDYISLIATTLIGMSISKQNSNQLPSSILKYISDYSKIRDNLEKVCIFMMDLVGKILDYAGCADMLPTDIRSFHITDKDVLYIIDKTAEIKNRQLERTFSFNDDNYDILVDLIVKCDMLLLFYKGRDRCHAHIAVSNHRQVLSKIRDQFLDANYRVEGLRMEPVCFLLAGGPGTLKTSALYHISRAISPFILTQEEKESCKGDYDTYVYNRCVEQGYWDGFTSDKRICFFDDFGQIRDMVGNADNEYMNLIRAVNEFEFSPHMADIGGKGNVKFRCKAVLATSNSTNWSIESIIETNAVKRRFDKTYIVIPKDDYLLERDGVALMSRKVDITKLPLGDMGLPSVSPDVLLFAEFDLMKQENTGIILTFDQLIDKIRQTYDIKIRRFEQKKIELRNRAKICSDKFDVKTSNDDDDKTIYFDAQVGFDTTKYKDLKPVYMLADENSSRYPQFIPDNDEYGKLTLEYLRFMYDALDNGDSSKISKFRSTVLYMKTINGIGEYHEAIYLYMLIKIYGIHFLEMLDSNHSPTYIAESLPFDADDFVNLLPGPTFEVSKLDKLRDVYHVVKKKINDLLYTPFRDSLVTLWTYYKDKRSTILEAFAAIGIAWSIYKMFKSGTNNEIEESQYGYNLRSSKAKNVRELSRRAKIGTPHESQFNWGEDTNGERLVEKIVKKNVYEIVWTNRDGSRQNKLGFVTFIIDTFGLVPKHFLNFLDMKIDDGQSSYDDFIVLSRRNAGEVHKKYVITVREFLSNAISTTEMENNDICLVRFPRQCGPHSNILDHFPTDIQVGNMKDMKGKLYIPDTDWQQCKNVNVSKVKNQLVSLDKNEMYTILEGYEYDAHTQKGDCGAILAIMDKRLQKAKIFGIHTAGRTTNAIGFASAVTYDMLKEILSEYEEDIIKEPLGSEAQTGKIISDGRYVELYEVDKPIYSSGKSSIIPSVLHSLWKPALLKPAILRPFKNSKGVIVNPMDNALLKYCSAGVYFPTEILEYIRDDYFDFLMKVSPNDVSKRILTYEESVLGIENEPLFKSVARKTSPGYPWIVARHGAKGKFHLFGSEDTYDLETVDGIILRKSVEELISLASQGNRSLIIFSDNLKDETRPIAKVDEGKTRLFSSCPIDYLLAFRMYFGSFSLWFMKNKIVNHSAIGVNPYSDEWHRIARMLLSKGHSEDKCIGAGDYSAFDGSEKSHIHWLIFDIVNKWYDDGERNALIRKVLWCDLVKSKHINGKMVYQWDSSLPSGHAWTIMVNGMYNEIAFRYCWAKSQNFDRVLMSKFDEYVYVIFMGDDNAFSVSPMYRESFNEMSIALHMKDIGLDYTTESKGKALVPLRRIDEIDFLKRAFKFDRNVLRYIAPLQIDVVLEIPFWTKENDTRTITIDNCNTSIKELSLHGKEKFTQYITQIAIGMKDKCHAYPFTTSYSVAFETVLNSEFML